MGRRGGGRGRGRRLGGATAAAGGGGGRGRGPRLDSRLLRQLDGGRKKQEDDDNFGDGLAKDFYEYEEGVAEEESGKNHRYDDVEHVEYELPSDFEDEEIDEDAALGEEDAGLEETINSKRRQDMSLGESDVDLNSDEEEDESGEEEDDEDESYGGGGEEDEESEEEEEEDDEKHQQMLEAVTGKPHQLRNGLQLRAFEKLRPTVE